MAYYLVERYVPSMSIDELTSAVARLDTSAFHGARHLWTVLVRGEDTCLSVFEAANARTVEAVNADAGFQVDRVVEVTPLEATRS